MIGDHLIRHPTRSQLLRDDLHAELSYTTLLYTSCMHVLDERHDDADDDRQPAALRLTGARLTWRGQSRRVRGCHRCSRENMTRENSGESRAF